MSSPLDPVTPKRPISQMAPHSFADNDQTSRQLSIANIQFRRGQTAAAEQAVTALLSAHPNDAAALELLADIRLSRNDFAGAQETLKLALASEPNRATAEAKLARTAIRRTEQERMATLGMAYAASNPALMRLSSGRKDSRWAVLGSALVPGLGQFISGETIKGVVLAAIYFFTIVLLALLPDTHGLAHQISLFFLPNVRPERGSVPTVSGFSWFLLIVMTGDWLYAVADAAAAARRNTSAAPLP